MVVSREEDCRFLTDRWGSPLDLDPPVTDEQRAAVARLTCVFWDECCFVVERGGRFGVLVELEYDDDFVPSESKMAAWARAMATVPGAEPYHTQGGHVFNDRYAGRVFLPESCASAAAVETVGRAALAILY